MHREGLVDRVGPTLIPSGVGFEGEGVAVGVLKPRYASTAGACGDSLGVVLELVVTDELDAAGRQLINDPIDVIDVPGRHVARDVPAVTDWYTLSAAPPPEP